MKLRFSAFFCAIMIVLSVSQVQAQDQKRFTYNFYGFVRNEFFVDTYKGLDAAYELFYVAPLYTGKDANGKDLNKQTSSNLSAIASRLGVNVSGPEVFNAKTNATIEVDFGGIVKTEPTLLRIRQAFVSLNWQKSSLLVGQTWHPFWGAGTAQVSGLNTGAPFQAFNRSPQVRYTQNAGDFRFGLSAVYESQYASKTFESSVYTSANQAQRNGAIPEFALTVAFVKGNFQAGIGGQMKRLKPYMITTGTDGKFVSDEYLTTYGAMAYIYYQDPKLAIVAKNYYGQNLSHLTILGGYGVKTFNENTGARTFTPFTTNSSLLNIVYGTKWQAGMTLGLTKNLGTKDPLYSTNSPAFNTITGGLLPEIKDLYRVAPHLSLNVSAFKFILEYELTSAKYGEGELDYSDGIFKGSHTATNNRFALTMMYIFK